MERERANAGEDRARRARRAEHLLQRDAGAEELDVFSRLAPVNRKDGAPATPVTTSPSAASSARSPSSTASRCNRWSCSRMCDRRWTTSSTAAARARCSPPPPRHMRRRLRRPQGVHAPEPLPRSHGRRDPPRLVPPDVPAPSRAAHPAGYVRGVRAAVLGTVTASRCSRIRGTRVGVVDVAQGFPVMGIWEDGSDRTDVNAVDRAKSGQDVFDEKSKEIVEADACAGGLDRAGYVVTADDFGKVKLFNYPSCSTTPVQGVQGPRVARHVRPLLVRRQAGVHRGWARPRGAAVYHPGRSSRRDAADVRAPAGPNEPGVRSTAVRRTVGSRKRRQPRAGERAAKPPGAAQGDRRRRRRGGGLRLKHEAEEARG